MLGTRSDPGAVLFTQAAKRRRGITFRQKRIYQVGLLGCLSLVQCLTKFSDAVYLSPVAAQGSGQAHIVPGSDSIIFAIPVSRLQGGKLTDVEHDDDGLEVVFQGRP
jgi:hypothetical protein